MRGAPHGGNITTSDPINKAAAALYGAAAAFAAIRMFFGRNDYYFPGIQKRPTVWEANYYLDRKIVNAVRRLPILQHIVPNERYPANLPYCLR